VVAWQARQWAATTAGRIAHQGAARSSRRHHTSSNTHQATHIKQHTHTHTHTHTRARARKRRVAHLHHDAAPGGLAHGGALECQRRAACIRGEGCVAGVRRKKTAAAASARGGGGRGRGVPCPREPTHTQPHTHTHTHSHSHTHTHTHTATATHTHTHTHTQSSSTSSSAHFCATVDPRVSWAGSVGKVVPTVSPSVTLTRCLEWSCGSRDRRGFVRVCHACACACGCACVVVVVVVGCSAQRCP
jgi:hypothetical protein